MHVSWSLPFVFPSDPKFEQKIFKLEVNKVEKEKYSLRLEPFKGQRMSIEHTILSDNTF